MRGWLIIAIIGAALLTTPATAQMRAARSVPARVASPASIRSFGFGTTNRGFVPHGFPNTSFGYHSPYSHYPVYRTYGWWPYYPYYGGYSYPMFWGSSYGSDQGASAYYLQYQQQDQMNQSYNEVQRLREQQALAAAPPPPQPSAQQQIQTVLPPPTTLVFRDGKTERIQNYAIVGKTLWAFNEQRARKIPVSELNIPATRKANEDHGVEFSLPE
jgi:hypothetical protein